jgi:hypothetical protein
MAPPRRPGSRRSRSEESVRTTTARAALASRPCVALSGAGRHHGDRDATDRFEQRCAGGAPTAGGRDPRQLHQQLLQQLHRQLHQQLQWQRRRAAILARALTLPRRRARALPPTPGQSRQGAGAILRTTDDRRPTTDDRTIVSARSARRACSTARPRPEALRHAQGARRQRAKVRTARIQERAVLVYSAHRPGATLQQAPGPAQSDRPRGSRRPRVAPAQGDLRGVPAPRPAARPAIRIPMNSLHKRLT